MSFGGLFGGEDDAPAPAPVPVSPQADDNAAAQEERNRAAQAALADQAARGRRSTIVAGMKIAADDQLAKGEKSMAKRSAVRETMGY